MAHAQKPDFVFKRKGRVPLNRRGRQFSRLLAAEVYASAVVMLDTPCSEVVWRVLNTHSIRQFPLHLSSRVSPCAITFHLDSTRRLITAFAISCQLPLSWTRPILYLEDPFLYYTPICAWVLQVGLFPSGLPTKSLYTLPLSHPHSCYIPSPHYFYWFDRRNNILWEV